MKENYVLRTNLNGSHCYFEKLSVTGCPLNDNLGNAKRFSFPAASRMASRLNSFLRGFPDFDDLWLYKVVDVESIS